MPEDDPEQIAKQLYERLAPLHERQKEWDKVPEDRKQITIEAVRETLAGNIIIEAKFFEHLLDCMCNQKDMPMPYQQSAYEQEKQRIIDVAYQKARRLWMEHDQISNAHR